MRNLTRRDHLYQNNADRKFFALFDFDGAYQDWVQLGGEIERDLNQGLVRRRPNHEGYAILLPVPDNLSVRDQVWNANANQTWEGDSRLSIELLFRDVPGLHGHFATDPMNPAGWLRFIGQKVAFAENAIPPLDAAHFECFRPVFEFIEAQINADVVVGQP